MYQNSTGFSGGKISDIVVALLWSFSAWFGIASSSLAYAQVNPDTRGLPSLGNNKAEQISLVEQIGNPRDLLPDFDTDTLVPILDALGFEWIGAITPGGDKVIFVRTKDDLRFVMMPIACKGEKKTNCTGLNLIALFGGEAPQRTVNSFNYRYPFSSAGVDPSGTAYISRHEIADFGIAKGNFIISIGLFLRQSQKFWEAIYSASRSVSREAFSNDLSANALNAGRSPADLLESQKGAGISHFTAFEKTADFVSLFVEADKKNPGNIINYPPPNTE